MPLIADTLTWSECVSLRPLSDTTSRTVPFVSRSTSHGLPALPGAVPSKPSQSVKAQPDAPPSVGASVVDVGVRGAGVARADAGRAGRAASAASAARVAARAGRGSGASLTVAGGAGRPAPRAAGDRRARAAARAAGRARAALAGLGPRRGLRARGEGETEGDAGESVRHVGADQTMPSDARGERLRAAEAEERLRQGQAHLLRDDGQQRRVREVRDAGVHAAAVGRHLCP